MEELVEVLNQVPRIISFGSSPDKITRRADFIFPDHHVFESWGYQKVSQGSDRAIVSGFQPIFHPALDTRATMDVLLSVTAMLGGNLQAGFPYQNQTDFLQKALSKLYDADEDYQQGKQEKFMACIFERGGLVDSQGCHNPSRVDWMSGLRQNAGVYRHLYSGGEGGIRTRVYLAVNALSRRAR